MVIAYFCFPLHAKTYRSVTMKGNVTQGKAIVKLRKKFKNL